jgi:uncharacterized protein (DUF58 family)
LSTVVVVPGVSAASKMSRAVSLVRRLAHFVWLVIASPVRLFLSIRRSMTGASVTLLVIGIVTLNIIWGYPWIGMFSACSSLLAVGWVVNRLMRPKIGFTFTLPRSAPAGQAVSLLLHGKNQGRLPAMDLSVGVSRPAKRRLLRKNSKHAHAAYRVLSPAHSLSLIEPGQRVDLAAMVAFDRRGIHSLPDLFVSSSFPFHLFRSFRRQPSETQLAITPRPLTGEEDAVARGMLDAFGGWSHKLLSGDALDYTGSREYQTGMPVRRWDFTSWARLGKPIVREFQSPSIQVVTLIVDTSFDRDALGHVDLCDELLERVLSLAATGITTLTQRLVRVRLCLTCEDSQGQSSTSAVLNPSDCESMLIRLAAADSVVVEIADAQMAHALEQVGRSPGMILTSRNSISFPNGLPSGVSVLRVDSAHHEAAAANPKFESPEVASHST